VREIRAILDFNRALKASLLKALALVRNQSGLISKPPGHKDRRVKRLCGYERT
jgi:hypothetical protein